MSWWRRSPGRPAGTTPGCLFGNQRAVRPAGGGPAPPAGSSAHADQCRDHTLGRTPARPCHVDRCLTLSRSCTSRGIICSATVWSAIAPLLPSSPPLPHLSPSASSLLYLPLLPSRTSSSSCLLAPPQPIYAFQDPEPQSVGLIFSSVLSFIPPSEPKQQDGAGTSVIHRFGSWDQTELEMKNYR